MDIIMEKKGGWGKGKWGERDEKKGGRGWVGVGWLWWWGGGCGYGWWVCGVFSFGVFFFKKKLKGKKKGKKGGGGEGGRGGKGKKKGGGGGTKSGRERGKNQQGRKG